MGATEPVTSRVVTIEAREITPEPGAVLRELGYPAGHAPDDRLASLLRSTLDLLFAHVAPVGIIREISPDEFAAIYNSEGRNEPETPLQEIFPRADDLALFAVTLGSAVSEKTSSLFAADGATEAFVLDAAASVATERAGAALERSFLANLEASGRAGPNTRLLGYSPGYCGWHISGQKGLFAKLGPEKIGITLNESFLMQPLKSISGVIVAGAAEIHDFDNSFSYCSNCRDSDCRERIKRILG